MTRREALFATAALSACEKKANRPAHLKMGEKATAGPLTYDVIAANWSSHAGDGLAARFPANRFYLVRVKIENHGKAEAFVPTLSIEDKSGNLHVEIADAAGIPDWVGVVRQVKPAGALEGVFVFDVASGSYSLLIPAEDTGEALVYIDLPYQIETPAPGA